MILDCPELITIFPDKIRAIQVKREAKKVPGLNMNKVREMMSLREK